MYKVRGCSLLRRLLEIVPSQLLERTGLGEVFQEALTPCLLYLPELTPEAESLQLLNAVYPSLLALVRSRFPQAKQQVLKQKALDQIFRYGILKGYAHAGENVKVAELLVRKMIDLVKEMGVSSCKHIKVGSAHIVVTHGIGRLLQYHRFDESVENWKAKTYHQVDSYKILIDLQHMLPLISGILTNPFATAYPPLLLVALGAIQSITVTNWPRIGYHRGDLLKCLAKSWCSILEDDEVKRPGIDQVQVEIVLTVRLLTTVVQRDVDAAAEYRLLARHDQRLEELLAI